MLGFLRCHPIYDSRYFPKNGYFREKFKKSYIGWTHKNPRIHPYYPCGDFSSKNDNLSFKMHVLKFQGILPNLWLGFPGLWRPRDPDSDRPQMKSWKALIYACTRKQHPLYPTVKLRTGPNYEIVNLLLHYGAVRFTSVSYTFCTFLVCTATLVFVFCSITRYSHLCNWANYSLRVLSRC